MLCAIFFDQDDTLLDFTWAEATALRRALTELDLPAAPCGTIGARLISG